MAAFLQVASLIWLRLAQNLGSSDPGFDIGPVAECYAFFGQLPINWSCGTITAPGVESEARKIDLARY
jgi:hypothetical protein